MEAVFRSVVTDVMKVKVASFHSRLVNLVSQLNRLVSILSRLVNLVRQLNRLVSILSRLVKLVREAANKEVNFLSKGVVTPPISIKTRTMTSKASMVSLFKIFHMQSSSY